MSDKNSAKASALATIIVKNLEAKTGQNESVLERVPLFVHKMRKLKRYPAQRVKGHNFEMKQFTEQEYCNQSGQIIWGIAPQAYRCSSEAW